LHSPISREGSRQAALQARMATKRPERALDQKGLCLPVGLKFSKHSDDIATRESHNNVEK